MTRWAFAMIALIWLAVPISLANWWLVFGIWPKSWLWFIFFSFLTYGQSELAKYVTKKWITSLMEDQLR